MPGKRSASLDQPARQGQTIMGVIRIKRIYDAPASTDGKRVLVDRIWPRGVSKEFAKLDLWLKEVAPSTDLRKWFDHNPARFEDSTGRASGRERVCQYVEISVVA